MFLLRLFSGPGPPVAGLSHRAALDHAAGRTSERLRPVVMAGVVAAHPSLTVHLPVWLNPLGQAEAAATSNSGDFIGLLKSSGCVTLAPGMERSTQSVPYTPWI